MIDITVPGHHEVNKFSTREMAILRLIAHRSLTLTIRVRCQIILCIYLCTVFVGPFGWLFGEARGLVAFEHKVSVCSETSSHAAVSSEDKAKIAHSPSGTRLDGPTLGYEADGLIPGESEASLLPLPTFQASSGVQPSKAPSVPKRDSPPIGAFGGQLLENFKGLFSKPNLKPLLIGSGATALTSVADDEVQEYFGATRRGEALGDIGAVVGVGISHSVGGEKTAKSGFSTTQTLTASKPLQLSRNTLKRSQVLSLNMNS